MQPAKKGLNIRAIISGILFFLIVCLFIRQSLIKSWEMNSFVHFADLAAKKELKEASINCVFVQADY